VYNFKKPYYLSPWFNTDPHLFKTSRNKN